MGYSLTVTMDPLLGYEIGVSPNK